MSLKFWEKVHFVRKGLCVTTQGLKAKGRRELSVSVDSPVLLDEAESFLKFVVDYQDHDKVEIRPGETMNYGYWLVKFEASADESLDVWEFNANATEFVQGASLTLRYWLDQHRVCREADADFEPPNPERLTAVSAGVLEGDRAVQAVRYPWAEPMSGWLIVTDLYDGNIDSLVHHHTYHVTASRPDLAAFLALPNGFRFELNGGAKVHFDPEAATQRSE